VKPYGLSGCLISTQRLISKFLLPFPSRVGGTAATGDSPSKLVGKSDGQIIIIVVCDGVVESGAVVVVFLVEGVETTGGVNKISAVESINGLYNRITVLLAGDVSIFSPTRRLTDVSGVICLGNIHRRRYSLCRGDHVRSRGDRVSSRGSDSLCDGEGL